MMKMDRIIQFFFKHKWSAFAKGEFGFANRPSWPIFVLIVFGLGLLIYFLYIHADYRINLRIKWGLIALRVSLLILLLVMIMRPVIVIPSVIPKSTTLAILADDSRSMQLADENQRRRIDAAKELLSPGNQFTRELDSKFKVKLYGFSTAATKIRDAGELKAEGTATDLVSALREAAKDSTGTALSAIVLLSDGGANTPKDLSAELRELRSQNIPVFTVGVGNIARFKDAEMVRATTPRRVLTGSTVSAEALVRLSGYGDTNVALSVSEDGRALKTQSFQLKGGEAQTLTIEYTPTSVGVHRYTFEIKPLD